jgi:2-polyprenyl-3-methyl-5-hydroxy-6-metoxy-1,4-benzoquinol methylase
MFLDPTPSAQEAEQFHTIPLDRLTPSAWYRRHSHWVNASRAQFLARLRRPGRLLDIGCGNGSFLQEAKRRGWETFGTELSPVNCRLAQERLGRPIHLGNLPDLELPARSFDVVTLWHVLEHVPEPNTMLAEIERILTPGGILIIEVPNIANPVFAFFGESYFPLDCPRHVCFYSKTTLAAMLKKHGLPIVKEDSPCWHYPESIAKSAAYRLGSICARRSLWYSLLYITFAPAIALATGCYLAASAIGAPPEVIRIAAIKPPDSSGALKPPHSDDQHTIG